MTDKIHQIWKWWNSQNKILRRLLVVASLYAAFSLYLSIAQPAWQITYFIYKPFKPIYSEYKSKLGRCNGEVQIARIAGYAVCEKSQVLWINDLGYHLIFSGNSWQAVAAPEMPGWVKKELYTREYRNQRFPECKAKGLMVAGGGLFKLWVNNPEIYIKTGCIEWGCQYPFSIRYQQFEHGLIIGTIPMGIIPSNSGVGQQGHVYALIKSKSNDFEGTIYRQSAVELPPKCDPWDS